MITFLALCAVSALAAEPTPVRALATISPTVELQGGANDIYLHGALVLRGQPGAHAAMRSDAYVLMGRQGGRGPLQRDDALLLGCTLHPWSGPVDAYLGLQPGLGLSSTGGRIYVTPLASAMVGVSAPLHRNFFVFAEARAVVGRHLAEAEPLPLDDLRGSFGLGLAL